MILPAAVLHLPFQIQRTVKIDPSVCPDMGLHIGSKGIQGQYGVGKLIHNSTSGIDRQIISSGVCKFNTNPALTFCLCML